MGRFISFSDVTVVSSASNESKESETTLADIHEDTSATDDLEDTVSVQEFDYSTMETYSNNFEKLLSDEGGPQNTSYSPFQILNRRKPREE